MTIVLDAAKVRRMNCTVPNLRVDELVSPYEKIR